MSPWIGECIRSSLFTGLVKLGPVITAAVRVSGGLCRAGYAMVVVYIVPAMALNYEVVGPARRKTLKSSHQFGFATLSLFGLLLRSHGSLNSHELPLGNVHL